MNKLRNSIFNRMYAKFENNKVMRFLIDISICSGLADFIYRTTSKNYLKDRIIFFRNNQSRINNNISCLADEKSKIIYTKMIEYREYRKRKNYPNYSTHDIYFPKDIIELSNEECFIDCGAYNGDTIANFLEHVKEYKNIVAFEPDKNNFTDLKKNTRNMVNVTLYEYGCWNQKDILRFNEGNDLGSKVDGNSNMEINVIDLDSIAECNNATFIKMDIEGSELEALKGAKNIIKNNKPKLAICLYHSDNDMIDIIEYIHKTYPDYKIFVRQHSNIESDTVMYCI